MKETYVRVLTMRRIANIAIERVDRKSKGKFRRMRIFRVSLWVLLVVLQSGFYFLALLYRAPFFWVAIPALTLAFYVIAVRSATSFNLGAIAIATCVGILISWDLMAFALTSSRSDSFVGLFYAVILFIFSNAFCFGGVALFRRAFVNYGSSG